MPLLGKPDNNTLIFTIPQTFTPDKFTDKIIGKITFKNPFTPTATRLTKQSPISFGTQKDFYSKQLKPKASDLGVTSVRPLKDQPCTLLTFHPNVNIQDIQLVLLTPPKDAFSLINEGKQRWSVKDYPKRFFEIVNPNTWSPKLQFTSENNDLGRLPLCKLAILLGPKDSPKCIAVLQLRQPTDGMICFTKTGNSLKWPDIDETFPMYAVLKYTPTGGAPITIMPDKIYRNKVAFSSTTKPDPLAIVAYKRFDEGPKTLRPKTLHCISNNPKKPFFFSEANLYKENVTVYETYLKEITGEIHKHSAVAFEKTKPVFVEMSQAKNIEDMQKVLKTLKTAFDDEAKHWTNEEAKEKDEASKGSAKIKKEAALQAETSVDYYLKDLDHNKTIIAAHHAFIKQLETAKFEMSVSWEVEPSKDDKALVESLSGDQTVHAVVPASKGSE